MKRNTIVAVFLAVLFIAGCGYSPHLSTLPSRFQTIHIAPFKNKVAFDSDQARNGYFPLLEIKVTNAVIDRFLFDGNLRIAKEDKANLILRGELTGYQRDALRYTENNEVLEYRVRITVAMSLFDVALEKTIWSEPNFSGEATYFISGALAKTESSALEDALTDLARRVVERTVQDW